MQDVEQQEMLDAYQDNWGRDATDILRQLTKPSRWTLHAMYPPLDSYVKGKIVLIGDAVRQFLNVHADYFQEIDSELQAHAMVPYLGAGVGQGFEDTYALCRILAHPKVTKDSLNVRNLIIISFINANLFLYRWHLFCTTISGVHEPT